jgi:non-ribosomal peptide synthase protein (TIGR01720 family)
LDLKRRPDPETALITIREKLASIQKGGTGYGILRYLSSQPGIATKLKDVPRAQVLFNYLGQFNQDRKASMFIPASESVGQIRSPRAKRSHLIEILGSITGGELELVWIYSENIHKRSTIEELAEAFKQSLQLLVAHCQSVEEGGYTPSDFPLAKLDQFELELIEKELE